jgi:hypothetical protein
LARHRPEARVDVAVRKRICGSVEVQTLLIDVIIEMPLADRDLSWRSPGARPGAPIEMRRPCSSSELDTAAVQCHYLHHVGA